MRERRLARQQHPTDRSAFLADVAAALNGHEIGDGLVGRVCRGALRLADAAGLPLGVAVARMRALAVSARRAVIPKRDDYPSGTGGIPHSIACWRPQVYDRFSRSVCAELLV